MSVLTVWSNFYVLTGSAAGALTGLMFVVITLLDEASRKAERRDGVAMFSTPTVAHFCAALYVSATLSAPWRTLTFPAVLIGLFGLYGVIYIAYLVIRGRRLKTYQPDLEDWTWYTALPFLAYATLLGGAIGLAYAPVNALFAIAAAVLALIFIGIRNAWDVVTFIATGGTKDDEPT